MQAALARSFPGAELYAAARCSSEAKGLMSFAKDFAEQLRNLARGDAQATIGLSFRSGLRKSRHIENPEYWAQELLEHSGCEFGNLVGEISLDDLTTKPVSRDILALHLGHLGCHPVRSASDLYRRWTEGGGSGHTPHFPDDTSSCIAPV